MKDKLTIIETALVVLRDGKGAQSVHEIYKNIIADSLYIFHAQDPLSVLRNELRSHSVGIDFPTASKKIFCV